MANSYHFWNNVGKTIDPESNQGFKPNFWSIRNMRNRETYYKKAINQIQNMGHSCYFNKSQWYGRVGGTGRDMGEEETLGIKRDFKNITTK